MLSMVGLAGSIDSPASAAKSGASLDPSPCSAGLGEFTFCAQRWLAIACKAASMLTVLRRFQPYIIA